MQDARREAEDVLLSETCPEWIIDVVVNRNLPKFIKIPFYLLPHPSSGIKPLRKDKLSASDMLQVRKVIEHVYEKMMGSETGSTAAAASAASSHSDQHASHNSAPSAAGNTNSTRNGDRDSEGGSSIAEEKVELLCQDQVLDLNMDLRTVRHFIWKSGGDLILHYRPLK